MSLGWQELIIILVIVLLLFGSTRIPQLAKGLGEGIRNFKKAVNNPDEKDVEDDKKNKDKN